MAVLLDSRSSRIVFVTSWRRAMAAVALFEPKHFIEHRPDHRVPFHDLDLPGQINSRSCIT